MADSGGLLIVGPWRTEEVTARWSAEEYEPPAEVAAEADEAITALRDRGSPFHDGSAARLVTAREENAGLTVELQPARWSLRLVKGFPSRSLSALCVVRDVEGRWLAGRRAPWVASWAGRWALGAGGAVEVCENPADTLWRELEEEWSVTPAERRVEAVVDRPDGLTFIIGTAILEEGAEPSPDAEHDDWAWWPADIESWPAEADEPLRRMASFLVASR